MSGNILTHSIVFSYFNINVIISGVCLLVTRLNFFLLFYFDIGSFGSLSVALRFVFGSVADRVRVRFGSGVTTVRARVCLVRVRSFPISTK